MLVDYPPLTALARLVSAPPQSVPPQLSALSAEGPLAIGPALERTLHLLDEDYRQLPLLAPVAIQYAAVALALASHRFLPYLPPHPALHQLHGLMRWQILANVSRDSTFRLRSSRDHFAGALRHLSSLRARLVSPSTCPAELGRVQRDLADLSVYLAFAVHTSGSLAGSAVGSTASGSDEAPHEGG